LVVRRRPSNKLAAHGEEPMVTSKDAKRMVRAGGLILTVGLIAYMAQGVIGDIRWSPSFLVLCVIFVGSLIGIVGMILGRAAKRRSPNGADEEPEASIHTLFGSDR
jgi:hypothetical protein